MTNKIVFQPLLAGTLMSLLGCVLSSGQAIAATITAPAGYTVSLFAADPSGASHPDSIAISDNTVFVGYGNGTASNGTDPTPNTIAEYTNSGQLIKTFSVPGHNDGLRVNPLNGFVYALLNQDGNPQLTIIDPTTGNQTTSILPSTPGRGYDDLRFLNGRAYLSITNPVDGTSPIVGELTGSFDVAPILYAGDTVVDGAGNSVTLDPATLDPDSLGVSPSGSLLLDDQGGEALISISNPGKSSQKAVILPHTGTSVDDTVFAPTGQSNLLVADTSGATEGVYQISGPFTAGTAYTSATGNNYVGTLNLTSGVITSFVSGLTSPHGLGFVSPGPGPNVTVPEPSELLGTFFFGAIGAGYLLKRRKNLA